MEMLASPSCNTALSGQPVKAAAGASLEVALTGWERVLPHRKNDWPFLFGRSGRMEAGLLGYDPGAKGPFVLYHYEADRPF